MRIHPLWDNWYSSDFCRRIAWKSEDDDDFRHCIGEEDLFVPEINAEKSHYDQDKWYDCVFSKHDIEVLITKLQNIHDNMEDYTITPEMDANYEEYLKELAHPENSKVDYERQRQEVKLIIDKDN